jgi:hypothetical protein
LNFFSRILDNNMPKEQRITRHFKPIYERPGVNVMHRYGGVYFLQPIDSRSDMWEDMMDIFDRIVTSQEFIIGLSFYGGNWIFPCNDCDGIFRAELEKAIVSSGYGDSENWSLMYPLLRLEDDIGGALRFFSELLSRPSKPKCNSKRCKTPKVLLANKNIATICVTGEDIVFHVNFKST